MTNHTWRIKDKYLKQLKSGTKEFEIRVGYRHITKVASGDTVTFEGDDTLFSVVEVRKYKSFKNLLEDIPATQVIEGSNFDSALKALKKIYPPFKEKLGVFAFKSLPINSKPKLLSLSDLIASDKLLFSSLASECYNETDWISATYPDHFKHYWSKYIPGIFSGQRDIAVCLLGDKLAGIAILKNDNSESKISTLFVKEEFRGLGVATLLIEESFKFLKTSKPTISISPEKEDMFKGVISKYRWRLTQRLDNYYTENSCELVYNGRLD